MNGKHIFNLTIEPKICICCNQRTIDYEDVYLDSYSFNLCRYCFQYIRFIKKEMASALYYQIKKELEGKK